LTTLVYDGKTLATDSCVSSNGLKFGSINKIIKLDDGRHFTGAGTISLLYAVASWLNGKTDMPEIDEDDQFVGIIVAKDGSASEVTNGLRIHPTCIPWTGGSGEHIAMTAIICGKDAVGAVEVACKLDCLSSGPINSVNIKGNESNVKIKRKT